MTWEIIVGFGGVLVPSIVLFTTIFFLSRASRRRNRLSALKKQIDVALTEGDLPELQRIRLLNDSELGSLDRGLKDRLDERIADMVIDEDDDLLNQHKNAL
jgi:hypothetical protein